MKKIIINLVLFISLPIVAGNGVERGRVTIFNDFKMDKKIIKYTSKKLNNCLYQNSNEVFRVKALNIETDIVDQGIEDLYYQVDIIHENKAGKVLNELSVEIEDADYSNYRKYEERLSIKLLRDKNNFCNL